jgi:hypothetical protein
MTVIFEDLGGAALCGTASYLIAAEVSPDASSRS